MNMDRVEEHRTGDGVMVVPAGMKSNEKLFRLEELDEQLFPGIPNDLALHSILSKLSWRACYTLSSVSPAWQRAIQTHQVYEARVRSQLAETLVLVRPIHAMMLSDSTQAIYLHSFREKCSYKLPPIPDLPRGFPKSCQCISLDGKVYVLGGSVERVFGDAREPRVVISDVYMLDIAGARKWKRCASMQTPRRDCGCSVLHGKIYVFGGFSRFCKPAKGSEVYDPEVDAWFPIKPIPSMRYGHQVATIGEELFVHGGCSIEEFSVVCNGDDPMDTEIATGYDKQPALFLEVYSPVMDEWRQIKPFQRTETEGVFVARGKLHLIDELGIHVYDMNRNSWTFLQSCSFPGIGPNPIFIRAPLASVVMDGELLVRLFWHSRTHLTQGGSCLVRSRGFSSEGKDIVWEAVEHSPMTARHNVVVSPIQI